MLRRHQINSRAGTPRLRSTLTTAAGPVRDAAWVVEEHVVWRFGDLLRRAVARRPRHVAGRAADAVAELLRRVLDSVALLFGRISDSGFGDLVRRISNSAVGDLLRKAYDILKRPFERLAWILERTLVWPLQERFGRRGGLALRAGLATAAVGAGVLALALVANSGGGGGHPLTRTTRGIAPVPLSEPAGQEVAVTPTRTLDGVAPDFRPPHGAAAKASSSGSKEAARPAAPAPADPTSVGSEKGSAGPVALKVAHRFADAFVLYETGQIGNDVRAVFGETATPRLSEALLRRPPRLPANVKVPQAKVVNVVPGPRHGPTYTVSVSLLRVGITSELRVNMQRDATGEWRVTDVLG